jgi:hypothetical protein
MDQSLQKLLLMYTHTHTHTPLTCVVLNSFYAPGIFLDSRENMIGQSPILHGAHSSWELGTDRTLLCQAVINAMKRKQDRLWE